MLFWWACFSSELGSSVTHLRIQSRICVSRHVFVTPVTNDIINMRHQSYKCVSDRKSASAVTICDPSHMLTLCAWDCTLSITYDVIACQSSTNLLFLIKSHTHANRFTKGLGRELASFLLPKIYISSWISSGPYLYAARDFIKYDPKLHTALK
jgi:hypothetical protein